MKIYLMAIAMFAIVGNSCDKKSSTNNTDNSTDKKGSFTIDGTAYSGKSSVQTFTNNNYSVLCEQDEPYKFIQITFHNKAEAEAGGTFTVEDYALNIASGTVDVGIDGLTFDPNGKATISVSGKKITISNLKLDQTGSGSKHPTVNAASIDF